MILDKRSEFADAVALNTGVAGSYLVGDVYDTQNLRDLGAGNTLFLVIAVQTAATSGGAATGQFNLVHDTVPGLGSATVLLSSAVFTVASMTAGVVLLAIALPMEGITYKRYLGIQQVTGVAAFTAGKIDAFLVEDFAKIRYYADAVN